MTHTIGKTKRAIKNEFIYIEINNFLKVSESQYSYKMTQKKLSRRIYVTKMEYGGSYSSRHIFLRPEITENLREK